jgi:hypothetical protein
MFNCNFHVDTGFLASGTMINNLFFDVDPYRTERPGVCSYAWERVSEFSIYCYADVHSLDLSICLSLLHKAVVWPFAITEGERGWGRGQCLLGGF